MKKKLLSLLLMIILSIPLSLGLSIMPAYASDIVASGNCGNNLTWEIDSSGTLTINGTGDMVFPSYGETAAPWHEYWTDIESIVITEGVTSISSYAFNNCSLAESISIPKSLKNVGLYAFEGCNFKKVYYSDLESYLSFPFGYYNQTNPMENGADLYLGGALVEDLIIPDELTEIPNGFLWGCTSIKSVTIPEGVTSINQYAFALCSNLKNVRFPKSLSEINSWAFSGCNNIEKLFINDLASYLSITYESGGNIYPLTKYGADLYIDNQKAETIVVPNGITNIGNYVLSGCNVKTVVIPEGVKSIGTEAFADCKNLSSITLPDSLRAIGQSAFERCSSLSAIDIPKSVKSIGGNAFSECSSLVDVYVPEGVTSIGAGAFQLCSNLTSIVLPEGIREIDECLLSQSSMLKSVSIPNGISTIKQYAFNNCNSLQSIYVPESVTSIQNNAFDGVYGTFYVKKGSYAEEYLTGEGKTIKYYCFEDHQWKTEYTVDKEATCTEEGSESIHCSVCDAIREGFEKSIPATGHNWEAEYTVDKEATYTEEGSESIHCSICGAIKEGSERAIAKLTPTDTPTDTPSDTPFDTPEDTPTDTLSDTPEDTPTDTPPDKPSDTPQDKTECDHNYSDWTITKEATCTADGSREKICSVCGDKVTESIPATGHKWNSSYTVDISATHASEGQESIHCSVCDAIKEGSQRSIAKSEKHEIKQISKAATCQEAGMKKHYECTVCHKMFKDAAGTKELTKKQIKKLTIKKKKHNFKEKSGEYLKSAATCTKPAYYYYTCKMCHQKGKKTYKVGKALGHDYVSGSIKKATGKKDGKIASKCSRCGKTNKGVKIPKASKIVVLNKKSIAYVGAGGEKDLIMVVVKNSKYPLNEKEYDVSYGEPVYKGKKSKGTVTIKFKPECKYYSGTMTLAYKITKVPKK